MMIESVKAAVKRYNMFGGAKKITVALSGGADSVALLCLLLELKDEYGFSLSAAHLNHCLRGEESDGDELFVQNLCETLGVPLTVERADVKTLSEKSGDSIELAARKARYEFLFRVSEELIATAHTANDNIETVLYNMARGTGLTGLCGIPPVRGRIVRPLLFTERSEIEKYCADNKLIYRTDSSNSDDRFTRNRIRRRVVPEMLGVNRSAVRSVSFMSEGLRDDADYLTKAADNAFADCRRAQGLDAGMLKGLHPAVRTRCIARLYQEQVGVSPERTHIQSVCGLLHETAARQSVQRGFSAVLKNGVLYFRPPQENICVLPAITIDKFPFTAHGVSISLKTAEEYKKDLKFNNLLLKCAVDYDKICGKLIVRGRLPGDRVKLPGRGTKSFKKLFNESRTDLTVRDALPVAADDGGVLWLCGFGADGRAAVTEETRTVLVFGPSETGE